VAETVAAGRHVDGAAGIGDEAQSLGAEHGRREPQKFRREMLAVGEHLGAHLRRGEHELGHAALHRSSAAAADRGH